MGFRFVHTRFFLFAVLLSLSAPVPGQTINPVAGDGTTGSLGDDGPASSAQFWSPAGLCVTARGIVYVADARNNRVRCITPNGTVATIAGTDESGNYGDNAPATDSRLNGPAAVLADNQGNLFIADKYNNRVRRINASGLMQAWAGSGAPGYAGDGGQAVSASLSAPSALALDTLGNLYIADAGNHCIRKVAPTGIITTVAGTGEAGFTGDNGPATAAKLNTPAGLAFDTSGNLLIADSWNYRVRCLAPNGIITTIAGTGVAGFSGDGKFDTSAELNLPTGLATDRKGNLFIADQGNNRIRRISANTIITTYAGTGNAGYSGDGGNALAADLNTPSGLATDAAGNLYVSEELNNRIRRITPPAKQNKAKPNPFPDNKFREPSQYPQTPALNRGTPVQAGYPNPMPPSGGAPPAPSRTVTGRGNKG